MMSDDDEWAEEVLDNRYAGGRWSAGSVLAASQSVGDDDADHWALSALAPSQRDAAPAPPLQRQIDHLFRSCDTAPSRIPPRITAFLPIDKIKKRRRPPTMEPIDDEDGPDLDAFNDPPARRGVSSHCSSADGIVDIKMRRSDPIFRSAPGRRRKQPIIDRAMSIPLSRRLFEEMQPDTDEPRVSIKPKVMVDFEGNVLLPLSKRLFDETYIVEEELETIDWPLVKYEQRMFDDDEEEVVEFDDDPLVMDGEDQLLTGDDFPVPPTPSRTRRMWLDDVDLEGSIDATPKRSRHDLDSKMDSAKRPGRHANGELSTRLRTLRRRSAAAETKFQAAAGAIGDSCASRGFRLSLILSDTFVPRHDLHCCLAMTAFDDLEEAPIPVHIIIRDADWEAGAVAPGNIIRTAGSVDLIDIKGLPHSLTLLLVTAFRPLSTVPDDIIGRFTFEGDRWRAALAATCPLARPLHLAPSPFSPSVAAVPGSKRHLPSPPVISIAQVGRRDNVSIRGVVQRLSLRSGAIVERAAQRTSSVASADRPYLSSIILQDDSMCLIEIEFDEESVESLGDLLRTCAGQILSVSNLARLRRTDGRLRGTPPFAALFGAPDTAPIIPLFEFVSTQSDLGVGILESSPPYRPASLITLVECMTLRTKVTRVSFVARIIQWLSARHGSGLQRAILVKDASFPPDYACGSCRVDVMDALAMSSAPLVHFSPGALIICRDVVLVFDDVTSTTSLSVDAWSNCTIDDRIKSGEALVSHCFDDVCRRDMPPVPLLLHTVLRVIGRVDRVLSLDAQQAVYSKCGFPAPVGNARPCPFGCSLDCLPQRLLLVTLMISSATLATPLRARVDQRLLDRSLTVVELEARLPGSTISLDLIIADDDDANDTPTWVAIRLPTAN